MPGTTNRHINGHRPSLNLIRARRPPPPPPVDAATIANSILDRISMQVRVAEMTAARHSVNGCPTPGACPPCAARERREWAERDATDRRAVLAQHRISAARLARRPLPPSIIRLRAAVRDAEHHPDASCRECRTTADGTECRSCGTTRATPAEIHAALSVLDAVNGRKR